MTTPVRRWASTISAVVAISSWITVIYIGHEYALTQKYILELREMSQEQTNLVHVVLSNSLPVLTTDEKGLIVSWNDGMEKQLGWKAEDVVGKPLWSLMDDNEIVRKHENAFKTGSVSAWIRKGSMKDCTIKMKDGKSKRVLVMVYEVNRPPVKYAAIIHAPKEVVIRQQVPSS